MTNNTNTQPAQEIDRRTRLEIIGTVLLSIASLVVAWCTYQSTLWNGEQDFRMAEANICYRRANEFTVLAAQQREMDASITLSFLEAVIDKRQDRIDYYLKRSDSELAHILTNWLNTNPLKNTNSPANPLNMPAYQRMTQVSKNSSDSAMRKAEELWREAKRNNTFSDKYTLFTVIFSLVVFLCAVGTKLTKIKVAYTCLIFASSIFFLTLILLIVTMPVARINP
ncbi:hypothetical protein A4D02_11405 [Niastella koreensis]|uniref:DUF4337 domain-containing protein n=2 Tax=Niastella koreensis TaxID=354356 RepID=G8T9H5_NIAKG|nr:hypothetical protein [Niastella koreensis]AEV99165.1 hypothetical protein Niako_2831 [Niastella koreensis GR20-10]OQP44067.1 hypothetical protein A4D02_11405 [Niastella koreensis]